MILCCGMMEICYKVLTKNHCVTVCCSCGLDSEAGSAGVSGADPAAQEEGGHSERRDGGAGSAEAFRHHLLWCERRRKVHQPGQGKFCFLFCILRNTPTVTGKLRPGFQMCSAKLFNRTCPTCCSSFFAILQCSLWPTNQKVWHIISWSF